MTVPAPPAPSALDRHRMAAARLWAATRFPYLATALFAMTVVSAPEVGGDGVAVDERWRLYVDPARAAAWSVEDIGALLVHHTGHLVRDHAGRARSLGVSPATSERWARAADAELNDDLADAGLVVPGDPLLPEALGYERGRLAEEYFHRQGEAADHGDAPDGDAPDGDDPDRPDPDRPDPEDGERDDDAGDGGAGAGAGGAGGKSGRTGGASTARTGRGDGRTNAPSPSPPSQPPPAPDHGSGSHAQSRPWEIGGQGEGEAQERPATTALPEGLSGHEGGLVRAAVANDILSALRSGQGNVPTNWQRWAAELLSPVIDWRRALAAEVRRGVQRVAGQVDYTYRRPSRRASVSPGVVLPALEKPVPEVAIVCDTSGSMGERELGRVLSEVEGLLSSIGLRARGVPVLAVDAVVHTVRRVSSARQVELVGGGGTDMAAGIEAAAALRPRPAVLVVLTDGLTPWPAAPPRGMRVIVGLLASVYGTGTAPSWARVVTIDDAA